MGWHWHGDSLSYSDFKDFTGFVIAALIACELTVNNAMIIANAPANANIHHWILILYAKSCNHLFIRYHVNGVAMTMEITTSLIKSPDNSVTMLPMEAPKTFLTPISLILCCAAKVANPNRPRQDIRMEITVNVLTIRDVRASAE